MPQAEQQSITGKSYPSYDSDSTIEDIDKITNMNAISMHAFKRIIEACSKDPKIVPSVGATLECLICDSNAHDVFCMKYDKGGQVDEAQTRISAATKSSAEEAGNSTRIPKEPEAAWTSTYHLAIRSGT